MKIPHSQPSIGEEEIAAVVRCLRSGYLTQGDEVHAFEEACAAFTGHRYGVAVSSGAAALHLALIVLGIRDNDRVAMPSYVCAALAQAITWQRATPVLCDIDWPSYTLAAEQVPSDCTAAIVPHLFGAPARYPQQVPVISDIAQSIGAPEVADADTSTQPLVTVASFYATKLMTTGEGGMLLTQDAQLAEAARDLREYDNRDDFKLRFPYKMTDFQAAMGRVQLQRLPAFIARRREIAAMYAEALESLPLQLPDPAGHAFFRYVVATEKREALEAHLQACGVEAKRPVYRPAHHYFGGAFPHSERAHQECLSIPLYPAMDLQKIRYVIESVHSFYQ